jgi:hypothetical protein
MEKRKYVKCKIVEAVADVSFGKSKSKIKLSLSAVQASVPEVCTKF